MLNVLKRCIPLLLSIFLAACGTNMLHGLGLDADTPAFWDIYNKTKADADLQAQSGKITWVQASVRVRDFDRFLADNKSGYDTSWKFDIDDAEYHAYVIAIAERLDAGKISFAEFDASRISKLNEIGSRRASINAQQQMINNNQSSSSSSGFTCPKSHESPAGMGTHCVYNCATGQVIQTIGAAQICPISIRR